jgi:ribonuclease BN (tRNA processing enzyme)
VALAAAPARVTFAPLPPAGEPVELGGFVVRAIELAHPGGAAGFRIDDPRSGASVAYIPDNELGAVEGVCGGRRTLLEAVAGTDLLIHDATYLPAELPSRRGWGHSSYAEAVRLAADAGVPRLVLFHHAPERADDEVERVGGIAEALGRASRGATEVRVGIEGDALQL